MENSNKWAIKINNKAMDKAIQTIAFSYGYRWNTADVARYMDYKELEWLIFEPIEKRITWLHSSPNIDYYAGKVVSTIEEAMELFENPIPQEHLVVLGLTLHKDGGVCPIGESGGWSKAGFDSIIAKRETLLGRDIKKAKPDKEKQFLPVLKFKYDGKNNIRYIALIKDENGYLEGLDIMDKNKYKKFCWIKVNGDILYNGIFTVPEKDDIFGF